MLLIFSNGRSLGEPDGTIASSLCCNGVQDRWQMDFFPLEGISKDRITCGVMGCPILMSYLPLVAKYLLGGV